MDRTYEDERGTFIWRYVGGRRIKIYTGQSLPDAMRESGKFPSIKKASPYDALMGKEFTGVKGQAAIDKLLEEKQGHVKAAFHRKDIGDITVFYGDNTAGLSHIVSQRRMQGLDAKKFASELGQTIERGKLGENANSTSRENVYYKNNVVVITYELRGKETIAVLTAFRAK